MTKKKSFIRLTPDGGPEPVSQGHLGPHLHLAVNEVERLDGSKPGEELVSLAIQWCYVISPNCHFIKVPKIILIVDKS